MGRNCPRVHERPCTRGRALWTGYGGTPADRDKYAYGYDRNSNRTYRENVLAGDNGKKLDELHAHDALNRLTEFQRGNLNQAKTEIPTTGNNRVRGEAWTLSPTGNWGEYKIDANGDGQYSATGTEEVDQDRQHNKDNELAHPTGGDPITELQDQPAWASPAYDAQGHMTAGPKVSYGGSASVAETEAAQFRYDAFGRLTEAQNAQGTTLAKYAYDGLNRRVHKALAVGEEWVTLDFYFNAAWQLLEVRSSDATTEDPAEVGTALKFQYVWSARYLDAPVLRDQNKDGDGDCLDGSDQRLYYLSDANMNVTALTDTSGSVLERYAYDPYGRVTIYDGSWSDTVRTASAYANRILFGGYYQEKDSAAEPGVYCVRNRHYHPSLGRWLTRDPLGYVDGMSLYEYCASAPTGAIDPAGTRGAPGGVPTPWRYTDPQEEVFRNYYLLHRENYGPDDRPQDFPTTEAERIWIEIQKEGLHPPDYRPPTIDAPSGLRQPRKRSIREDEELRRLVWEMVCLETEKKLRQRMPVERPVPLPPAPPPPTPTSRPSPEMEYMDYMQIFRDLDRKLRMYVDPIEIIDPMILPDSPGRDGVQVTKECKPDSQYLPDEPDRVVPAIQPTTQPAGSGRQ